MIFQEIFAFLIDSINACCHNKNKEKIMKKSTLIVLTILSSLLAIFGYFHIPILGALGVDLFPNRSFVWLLFLFPFVIFCNIPLVFCIMKFRHMKKKNKMQNVQNGEKVSENQNNGDLANSNQEKSDEKSETTTGSENNVKSEK